ncbi:hypothetical protein [Flagellimonas myxillae]|uniref:hypothetical protein n=1 Tax=Flagellimonas myxillae TaxID=2942214 RepID=UPI00201F8098|nr:hypothetical protein [Muricauda myxillae]MCL6265698.1 hypothetical protein [Muricauda myxillae]
MKTAFQLNLRLSYLVLGLLTICFLGLWLFLEFFPENGWFPTLIDVMAYCTGSVAILTLVYHALNLTITQNIHKENLAIRKNQYSFEVIAKFHEPSMANTLRDLRDIRNSPKK